MNKTVKWILIALAAVLVFVGVYFLYQHLSRDYAPDQLATERPRPSEATGEPEGATEAPDMAAPDFTAQDWDGNEIHLTDFVGKPIVLNFWASWCGPCQSEMPDFQAAYEVYGQDIHFMMVNLTQGRETMEAAKTFIEERGFTFPVYFDTRGSGASTYGAYSIPMTFFIDADGNLVAHGKGMLSAENLETGIGMILEK